MDQYIGTLLGGCCGDIYGSLTEGLTANQIHVKYGNNVYFPKNKRYTDDTEMTIALGDYLVSNRKIERIGVHRSYIKHFNRSRGYSEQTSMVLSSLEKDNFERAAGSSIANGAVMRIAPLGLIKFDSDQELINSIAEIVYFTHHTADAVYSAFLHCKMIRDLVENKFCSKIDLLNNVVEISKVHPNLFVRMNVVRRSLYGTIDNITYEIMGNRDAFQINAVDAIACAYYLFFKHIEAPVTAIYEAVILGGDCDTIAKLVGDLVGARYGTSWIPDSWKDHEGQAELIEMGRQLFLLNETM